ncbi:MAG: flagellar motor switch protein FliG [Acidimicrobiales bacterium]
MSSTGSLEVAGTAEMSGVRKVAVLLMSLDTDRAARLLRELESEDVAAVVAELQQLNDLEAPTIDGVIEDFARTAARQRGGARGGSDFVHRLLVASLGPDGADGVYELLEDHRRFGFLDAFDVPTLVTMLADEHPQTIAVVLAHLAPDRAARILGGFEEAVQCEIGIRIATMERTNAGAIDAIESALRLRAEAILAEKSAGGVGGVESLIALLTKSDKATERAVLAELEQLDPAMAEEVRAKLFTFEDIVTLDDRAVQQILRQVDTRGLAIALKGTEEVVRDKVLKNMSSRASENLLEEIDMLKGIRAADVKDARGEIVKVIRTLEDSGDIVINRGIDELVD